MHSASIRAGERNSSPPGFPRLAVGVGGVPAADGTGQQVVQGVVGVVEGEAGGEGGVGVDAGADWVGGERQEAEEALDEQPARGAMAWAQAWSSWAWSSAASFSSQAQP